MPEIPKTSPNVRQARTRALIVPREHGAWGLLFVPLFTGVVAGIVSAHQIWSTLVFAVAALSLFWLRTPVESQLGTTALSTHTSEERRIALIASIVLAAVSAACLTTLLWNGRNLKLLLIGSVAAIAFLLQAILRRLGRSTRMAAQLVGTIGLTSTASAAYYIATGHLDRRALTLWTANWLFASNQIHFVQLRIHAASTRTFSERFARGWIFFLGQPALLVGLVFASLWRLIPPLVVIAFIPALVRGTLWFLRKWQPLDIKSLGWSEMRQGVAFGVLLAVAFIFS